MKVRLSKLADAEFEEARSWYEVSDPAIAISFFDEVNAMMNRIGDFPSAYAVAFAQMRRAMLKKFPYFLLYEVFEAEAVVFGVIHAARDPDWWMTRGNDA